MKVLGNARRVYVSASATPTSASEALVGEVSNSFDLNANLVETSDKSTAWQQFISGIKGASAQVTLHADIGNADQMSLISSLIAGTELFVYVGNFAGTGEGAISASGYAFKALVSTVNESNDNGSVATRTVTLTANGAVTAS